MYPPTILASTHQIQPRISYKVGTYNNLHFGATPNLYLHQRISSFSTIRHTQNTSYIVSGIHTFGLYIRERLHMMACQLFYTKIYYTNHTLPNHILYSKYLPAYTLPHYIFSTPIYSHAHTHTQTHTSETSHFSKIERASFFSTI